MEDTKELLHACQNIAGLSIRELAKKLSLPCPNILSKDKGWIGKLLEASLGVKANNLPIPDFPTLGIELKTIPIHYKKLEPIESTYVCSISFNQLELTWEQSVVNKKLAKVLWIPIAVAPHIDWLDRKIGTGFLWEPTEPQLKILRNDWEELTEMLYLGKIDLLSAHYGQYLQLRPKANNCRSNLIKHTNLEDNDILTVARGFYLRRSFTKEILLKHKNSR